MITTTSARPRPRPRVTGSAATTSGRDAVLYFFDQPLDRFDSLLRRGGALMEHCGRHSFDAGYWRLFPAARFALSP